MKVVSYKQDKRAGFGVVSDDGLWAIDATAAFDSLRRVLETQQLSELAEWAASREPDIELTQVSIQSPVPDARRVVCIGVNYDKIHPVHGVMPQPDYVSLFSKFEGSLVGHLAPLKKPENTDTFDYEGEITLVIGKTASRVAASDAAQYIAGVTILNDGSVRQWQKHSVGAGKNFESASSIGPWMATLDDVGDLDKLHMTTFLNDELVQDVVASDMIFGIGQLLEYVTDFTTLEPGDILSTGSPERRPLTNRTSQYLQVGDQVSVTIDGVGTLTNHVITRGW